MPHDHFVIYGVFTVLHHFVKGDVAEKPVIEDIWQSEMAEVFLEEHKGKFVMVWISPSKTEQD